MLFRAIWRTCRHVGTRLNKLRNKDDIRSCYSKAIANNIRERGSYKLERKYGVNEDVENRCSKCNHERFFNSGRERGNGTEGF